MLAALEHIPYVTPSGREPVTDFLVSLSPADMEAVLADIEEGWPVGFPLVRKLEANLWEVRSDIAGGIVRTIFTIVGRRMVTLRAINKKSDRIALPDIRLARKRGKAARSER
ncbi:MAG: type II toxin-antitoxin system RelE/ParE family toxin [Ottowia sp.]|nr:type II toxin-antitoxin system RelE/ParE family toxin [Ottowia sp.]